MGTRKNHNNNSSISTDPIEPNIRKSKTHLSKLDPEKEKSRKKIRRELRNSDESTVIERITRIFHKRQIHEMLYEITEVENNNIDGIYLSHLQIYKQCKNVINSNNSVVLKSDDSILLKLGNLLLLKELNCYLFSLINPDVLNFDENGNFVNDFVENHIKQISEWEYKLRMSLLLDGFFQAIDDLIITEDSNYFYPLNENSNSDEESNKKSDDIPNFGEKIEYILTSTNNRKDYKAELSHVLSYAMDFYERYNINTTDDSSGVNFFKFITPKFFVSRNYEQKYIGRLEETYNGWRSGFKRWKSNNTCDSFKELFCLYHINRFSHIIDMKNITDYSSQSIPIHRFEGLFTPIIIKQIFEENDLLVNEYTTNHSISKYRGRNQIISCSAVNENLSQRNISERDIVFIKHIIDSISYTFYQIFFVKNKMDNNKEDRRVHDYDKAFQFFFDFSEDKTTKDFLDKCNFLELIETLEGNPIDKLYYRRIYEDLTITANDD